MINCELFLPHNFEPSFFFIYLCIKHCIGFQESLTESAVPPSNIDDDQPGQLVPLVAQVPDIVQSEGTPSTQG